MRFTLKATLAAVVALGGCNPPASNQPQANLEEANQAQENAALAPAPEPAANRANAVENASLPEPKGPIDPKSVEAAGQVVQHYGALIERFRYIKAERLWGDLDTARHFAVELGDKFQAAHLEIGNLGSTEGAAGSIYTTVPVVFYGQSRAGKAVRLPASVVLRRVNDVPGSTEEQRRWHIERIEWK
jgi:hypothetical protein